MKSREGGGGLKNDKCQNLGLVNKVCVCVIENKSRTWWGVVGEN